MYFSKIDGVKDDIEYFRRDVTKRTWRQNRNFCVVISLRYGIGALMSIKQQEKGVNSKLSYPNFLQVPHFIGVGDNF